MLASTLILIALLCAGVLIKVPYSEMSPGPTVNTLGDVEGDPVLRITGHKTYKTSGNLNMTTVRVTGANYNMNLVEAVAGWLGHDSVVVPHDTLYPDGKTEEQSTQENAEEFSQSQESAKVAALKELNIPPVTSRVVVSTVVKDSPSQGRLHAGDIIKNVDGTAVEKPEDVAKLVTKHKPGQKVTFTVVPAKTAAAAEKAGKEPEGTEKVTLTTVKAPPDEDRAIVGIQAGDGPHLPVRHRHQARRRGRPSAGLMFSLGIVDKLTPGAADGRQVHRRYRHHR